LGIAPKEGNLAEPLGYRRFKILFGGSVLIDLGFNLGVVGDGGFLMTGLETLTANTYKKGVVYFVFHDGELGQISQFQKIPLKRKTASVIGNVQLKGIATHGIHWNYDFYKSGKSIKVAIDEFSAPYINGATLDYVKDFMGGGFTIKNPNAMNSCGCGNSFSC
jgi:Fe-S cluster assembly iron-binding protein IscA